MDTKIPLLVVDDEQIVLDSICKHLRNESDLLVETANSVDSALKKFEETNFAIVLTDLMMPDIDGLELIKLVKERNPEAIIIMITGYATINTALQAMQLGAFDYIAKPFTKDELKKVVQRAAEIVSAAISGDSGTKRLHEPEKFMSLKGFGENSWIMHEENGTVLIGVERPLLYTIGRIQTVYLPSVGDIISQGSVFFQIFSNDLRAVSLMSPLSGTVIEVNNSVFQDPNAILQDPYGAGWLIRLEPSDFENEVKLLGR